MVNLDAFNYLRREDQQFDRVIIDLPDPHNEALNKLYSYEFYVMASRVLAHDGVLVTQSSSPFFTRRAYWCIQTTLAEVFPQTLSYQIALPSFGIWGFHLASKSEIFRNQTPYPDNTKAFDADTFMRSQIFEKDIARIHGLRVNTLDRPILYDYYLRDLADRNQQRRL